MKPKLSNLLPYDEKGRKNRIVGCGVIARIYKDETDTEKVEILLVQRSSEDMYPNAWELPRGGCNVSDGGSKNCIVREIKEETGLDVKPIHLLGEYRYLAKNKNSICKVYLCKMIDDKQKVKISFEHKSYQWVRNLSMALLLLNHDQFKFAKMVLDDNHLTSYDIPDFNLAKNNFMFE